MSEAFRCDGCREFFSGSPAMRIKAQGRTYTRDRIDYIEFDQHGGVDDYNPVTSDVEEEINVWPKSLLQSKSIHLCAGCVEGPILNALHATVHERET